MEEINIIETKAITNNSKAVLLTIGGDKYILQKLLYQHIVADVQSLFTLI